MSKSLMSRVASALTFAHLAALTPGAAKAEGDDKNPEDKGKTASEDDKDDDDDTKPKETKAEGDDKEKKGEEYAKAQRAEGVSEGRAAERERCAAIFASPAAARNVQLAAELAFNSDMSAEAAIAALGKAAPARAEPAGRSARNPSLGAGAPAQESPAAAIASSWDAAAKRAGVWRQDKR